MDTQIWTHFYKRVGFNTITRLQHAKFNTITILQHTIFGIVLPAADVLGDINFAIAAFVSYNYGIACLMILPVLLNMAFTFHKWFSTDFDTKKEKRLSLG